MKRARPYDRDKALDAALNLFWEKGYHATSLKDLEEALSMKPGSIYAAFKSKEALYLAALERYYLSGREALRAQMDSAPSVLAGLADHLRGYGRGDRSASQRRACMIVKTMLGTTSEDAAIAQRAREYYDGMRAEFARYFRKAQEAGELPANANPDRLAQRFQANVTALRVEAHRGADLEELANLAETMAIEIEEAGVSAGGRTKR